MSMGTLDRYIARQFLINVVNLFVILFFFVITVDVALNVDRFTGIAREMARARGEAPSLLRTLLVTVMLVADLWWPQLLQLFNYMLGLVLVGAMGFTFSQMVRHREMVAMLSGGISLFRAARPVMLVALGFLAVQLVNTEVVLPRIAPLLTRDHGDAGRHDMRRQSVPLAPDGMGRLFFADEFDADRGVLQRVYILERGPDGLATRAIRAESAAWRDGAWVFTGGMAEARGSLEPAVPIDRLESNLDPTELKIRSYEGFKRNLSWSQIGALVARSRGLERAARSAGDTTEADRLAASRETLERVRYGRVSVLATNLLALVICIPFFLTRSPGGMVARSLKCAPLAILSIMGGALGSAASIPGVPAALGAFIPVMILAPLAVAMATSVRT